MRNEPLLQQDKSQRPTVVSRTLDREWFRAIEGELIAIRVHSRDTEGRYAILDSTVSPGTATPLHLHAEDEIFEILEGTMTFVCDGERFEAPSGTIIVVPAGQIHAWGNFTLRRASMRVTFMPGGIEDAFPQIGGLPLPDLEKLIESYGSKITGPVITR